MNRPISKPREYKQTFLLIGLGSQRLDTMTFKLDNEKVPVGEGSRTFSGYPTFYHALAVASTIPNIGLIYQMSFDDKINRGDDPLLFGSFLVFDTGVKPFPATNKYWRVPLPSLEGVYNVRYSNLEVKTDPRSWKERAKEITDRNGRTYADSYRLAAMILRDFAHLESSEIYASSDVEDKIPKKDRQRLFRAERLNVDLTEGAGYGYHLDRNQGSRFCEKSSIVLPDAYIAVTRDDFGLGHELYVLTTMVHEAVHLHHSHRAAFLLRQWRRIKGRTPFLTWIDKQSKSKKPQFTRFDYLVAAELCGSAIAGSLIHFEPHVEAWILKVSHLPVSELRSNPLGTRFDMTTIQDRYYTELDLDGLNIVKEHLKDRLVNTYENLSEERRQAVKDSLSSWLATQTRPKPFIEWLFKIWSIEKR